MLNGQNLLSVAKFICKSFQTEPDRHNGILMSLLLLVAETIVVLFDLISQALYLTVSVRHIKLCQSNFDDRTI